jgi:enoyl-[acyl-carrier protein] reductase / trans-2-enoyl-CoA reductase (NAD+)
LWKIADSETVLKISDLEGYRADFNNLFGFKVEGVNYQEDTNEMVEIPGLVS